MYDEAAERWHDELALLGYPRAYEDLFNRLLLDGALNALRDGGRVLDCGVGTGAFSLALARKVAGPLRIEGVELSPSMLLRATLNLDRAGVEARLHLRDAKDLPFEDNTFDAVIGAHVLEHLARDRLMFGMEGAGLIGVRVYPLLAGGPLPRRTSVAFVGFKEGGWQW